MSEGTKIDYVQHSLNPLGWSCYGPNGTANDPRPCAYCYAARQAKRCLSKCLQCNAFVSHTHFEQLLKLAKWKAGRVFVCTMSDMFHPDLPDDWRYVVMADVLANPQHTYLFLTKRPDRMREWLIDAKYSAKNRLPDNLWFGASVTCEQDSWRLTELCHIPGNTWVSLEPLHGPVDLSLWLRCCPSCGFPRKDRVGSEDGDPVTGCFYCDNYPELRGVGWVTVGAETGNRKDKIKPKREWIEDIVDQCRVAGVPIFEKRSLAKIVNRPLIQEFPEVSK